MGVEEGETMKLGLILGLVSSVMPSPMKAELDVDRLIQCIIHVEAGSWGAEGGAGNMLYAAWSDSSDLSYQASRNEALALPVYRKHIIEKIIPQLKSFNCKITPQTVASCWRWGVRGARKLGFKSKDGERVSNLYFDKEFNP